MRLGRGVGPRSQRTAVHGRGGSHHGGGRRLLLIAHKLLTRDEPYRGENAGAYLRKLASLAAFRSEDQRRPRGSKTGGATSTGRARYR
jgi:hypothetical protein